MTLYLEQYLDSLQGLPADLQRNLKLLRDHDEKANQGLREIDRLTKNYVKHSGSKSFSKDARAKKYEEIQEKFKEIRALADDKVLLGGQTYEMVDKHIRRLDADLSRFENDIKRRFLEGKGRSSPDEEPTNSKKTPSRNKKSLASPSVSKSGKKRKLNLDDSVLKSGKKKKKKGEAGSPSSMSGGGLMDGLDAEQIAQLSGPALFQQLAGVSGGEVLDMPVDPNEPTYCLCHQVSYGEMVGCDNVDCPIEWFHFGCVNLSSKPKGKWFCPRCQEERKKKAAH